ncbi:MAG: ATP-binding cassette domain-containing protein [Lachnospiraceae bacterium]|nr:ATP-binding cassette domain-containing protein [Lachnospiraceae bacterium]
MVQVKDLRKYYKVNERSVQILRGLNCTIQKGEFVSILGPSGCGKSTFLNILAGLTRADNGEIIVNGKPTKNNTDVEWDNWRKKNIGIIFQSFHLIPHLSALENVELAMSVAAYDKHGRRKRAMELLERVGLKERSKNKPAQLSGGQKQRVAIARALANSPELILADEPTGALDSATSKEIMDLLHSLNDREGVTVIMVTHDEQIAAQTHRNIRMLDGEIVEDIVLQDYQECVHIDRQDKKEAPGKKQRGMKFSDSFLVAVRNICVKKKRLISTVLGISVGIFSVMMMMGITNGVAEKVGSELDKVSAASLIQVVAEGKTGENLTKLEEALKQKEEVTAIADVYLLDGLLSYGEEFSEEIVRSYSDEQNEGNLLYGKYPSSDGEIVVNKKIAERFAKKGQEEDLLGKTIMVYLAYSTDQEIAYAVEKECTVVGITSTNLFGMGYNYVSNSYAEKIAAESVGRNVEEQRINVYLADKAYRDSLVEYIQNQNFSISSSKEMIDTINNWIEAINNFLLLITGISLVVAVVMVIIVQYMSVAERRREIGILRAIGARKQDIRNIFLMEAGFVGAAAGILGVAASSILGSGINRVVYELMQNGAFSLYLIRGSVLTGVLFVSMLLCILAGYLPARQAASVDTIEVLK